MEKDNSVAAGAAPLLGKPTLRLVDRLRGIYTVPVNDGAGLLNGSDTFTRTFEAPPIQKEAAALIDDLTDALEAAVSTIEDYLAYEHSGDPWVEDARAMREMDIDDYKRDGRLERARASLRRAKGEE